MTPEQIEEKRKLLGDEYHADRNTVDEYYGIWIETRLIESRESETQARLSLSGSDDRVEALVALVNDMMQSLEYEICSELAGCGECDAKREKNEVFRSRLSAITKGE
jgi:hypothetical protein